MALSTIFASALQGHRDALDQMASLEAPLSKAADLLIFSLLQGGKVLLVGNGGSSSDAQHFAGELVGRFLTEREPLPAIPLAGQEAALTAIANDYSYNEVFSRQVRALGASGDVLVAISTSGNSANIVAAAEAAREKGVSVISLTGQGGGELAQLSDVLLAVPSTFTPRVQEMHILMIHVLCEAIDDAFPIKQDKSGLS
jgi:D-sedoheptulose 7-phosphate isomerase